MITLAGVEIDTSQETLEELEQLLDELQDIEKQLKHEISVRKLYSHKNKPNS